MGADPDQLRREIEDTRQELSADVDALTEKVHPARVMERRVNRTREAMGNVRERVMGSVSDAASSVSGGISSAASGVGDTAGSAGSRVGDSTATAGQAARRRAEGNPLAAGLVAFGVGWLVSSLLPASQPEQQAASRLTDVARDKAQPIASQALSEMKDNLREPAQHAVESVRDTASEAAGTVQEQARSSASEVTQDAQRAGERVREHASSDSTTGRTGSDLS